MQNNAPNSNKRFNQKRDHAFWKNYPGIVWSNPNASDSVMIANTLLQEKQHVIIAIANHFGAATLQKEWENLKREASAFPEILKIINKSRKKLDQLINNISKNNV